MLVNSCSPQNRVAITKLTVVSGLQSTPAMNHNWELFRRPLVGSLFQGLEWTQLARFGEETIPFFFNLFAQAYLETAFRTWESALFALSQSPSLLLLPFRPFSYRLVCRYFLAICSPPLQFLRIFFFLLFLLSLHPLYMTVTLLLLLPLVVTCHWFLLFILSRIAPLCWDLGDPVLSHSCVYTSSH